MRLKPLCNAGIWFDYVMILLSRLLRFPAVCASCAPDFVNRSLPLSSIAYLLSSHPYEKIVPELFLHNFFYIFFFNS